MSSKPPLGGPDASGARPLLRESPLLELRASFSEVIHAGTGFTHELSRGQILRIVDLEGNQAVDTLFYNARNLDERYSACDTIRRQGNIYLTTGTELISSDGRPMLSIIADTCGRHDTLGGACSAESNQVRYALEKKFMHNCRDTFLLALARYGRGMGKRDLANNINFFMNVPVTLDGKLSFEDGVSGPGRYVELRAEMDVLVLISNCPQLNNPCNAYNPTPVRALVWDRA
jgi:urea carboxylase-associated protein 1